MPLKILLLSHNFYPFIGGIEVNSEIFAHAFVEQGHEVRLLTWSHDPTEKEFPFKVIRNPGHVKLIQAHAWADVVFENNPCLRLAWPGVFFGKPSVVALNTWVSRQSGEIAIQDRLKFLWLKRAEIVVAASYALRNRTWPAAKVIVNPYRKDLFRIMPEIPRSSDFVFLGRLVSDKGADLAVKAIHQLKKIVTVEDGLEVEPNLTIIGEGVERANLERLVNELNLQDSVHFAGPLRGEELAISLNRHRFMLIPSVWEEPFGMVALEGMACGCLPIASDGGGLPEAVGRGGVLFRRGNVDDLLASILHVLRNHDIEQQCREAATSHLEAHQSHLVAKLYLETIESAV